jgi:putative ATPase
LDLTIAEDVKEFGGLPIPLKVRNAPTKLMKDLEYGKGYTKYDTESFLPEKLKNKTYLSKDISDEKKKRGLK